MLIAAIQRELESLGDASQVAMYGAGDRFRGIGVPILRGLAKKYQDLSLAEARRLLQSAFHEDRLLVLLILIRQYHQGDQVVREKINRFYLGHTGFVNNWDLVDASAPHLVGHYLEDHPNYTLARLAASVAIIATFHFIKRQDFNETLRIARLLLGDPEDLIHKAVGLDAAGGGKARYHGGGSFLTNPLP